MINPPPRSQPHGPRERPPLFPMANQDDAGLGLRARLIERQEHLRFVADTSRCAMDQITGIFNYACDMYDSAAAAAARLELKDADETGVGGLAARDLVDTYAAQVHRIASGACHTLALLADVPGEALWHPVRRGRRE